VTVAWLAVVGGAVTANGSQEIRMKMMVKMVVKR